MERKREIELMYLGANSELKEFMEQDVVKQVFEIYDKLVGEIEWSTNELQQIKILEDQAKVAAEHPVTPCPPIEVKPIPPIQE